MDGEMMAGIGKITYVYTPDAWSQDEFLRLGGFTVVFLNYNKAAFIEKSVASALAQDFPLCEMFFMDDASTDGSGDTMERLVREYRGRHKVTVVRNTENQHICGQWNIVAKLATGNWFGMFCGDDVAHADRVSVVARLITGCPTLRGLCTDVNEVSVLNDDEPVVKLSSNKRMIYQCGDADMLAMTVQDPPIVGATAWWHKSLFSEPLPKGPLDDVILRWVLQLKFYQSKDPIWLWDGVDMTVDYSVGAGITTDHKMAGSSHKTAEEKWIGRTSTNRHFAQIALRTWTGIEEYFKRNNAPRRFMNIVRDAKVYYRIVSGNTFSRIFQLPSAVLCSRNYGAWVKFFVQEFFGLRFAAFVSHRILSRI